MEINTVNKMLGNKIRLKKLKILSKKIFFA